MAASSPSTGKAALDHRRRTGQGQYIDQAQAESALRPVVAARRAQRQQVAFDGDLGRALPEPELPAPTAVDQNWYRDADSKPVEYGIAVYSSGVPVPPATAAAALHMP